MSTGRRIFANTAYRGVADLASKVATTVLFIVMARKLGDEDFGVFTFALALVTLVTVLADFGQNSVLTREVARNRAEVDRQFANNIALKLILAVPALGLALAYASATSNQEAVLVVALLGTAVVAELLRGTCFAVFEAHERLVFIPIALSAQRFLTTIVGVVALLLGAGVVAVSAIYLAGALFAFVFTLALLFRYVVRPQLELDVGVWRPLMRAALPIGLAGVFGTVLFRVDTAMLAAFESEDVVGNYGAAYRLFEATLFVGWSIGAAVYPVFSRLTPTTSPRVGAVFERAIKFSILATLPLALCAAVLAEPIVELLYGADYDEAANALRLLAPAIPLYPVAYLAGLLCVARDRQRVLTIVLGVVALQNILCNFFLIPWLSLDGAALGTSVSQFLAAIPLLIVSGRICGDLHWRRMLSGAAIAGTACAATMIALVDRPLLALASAAAVYVGVLASYERRAFPEDAHGFFELLRRRPAAAPTALESDIDGAGP